MKFLSSCLAFSVVFSFLWTRVFKQLLCLGQGMCCQCQLQPSQGQRQEYHFIKTQLLCLKKTSSSTRKKINCLGSYCRMLRQMPARPRTKQLWPNVKQLKRTGSSCKRRKISRLVLAPVEVQLTPLSVGQSNSFRGPTCLIVWNADCLS